jgi:hypothetical protein
VTGNAAPEDGGTDWRRLAGERNVPLSIARALWERACAAASGDPVQAEHAFLLLLEEAEAANITQEPGRGTLADSSAREGFSPGPGKWTRVLIEQPKPARPAPRPPETGKKPSADQLRNEILAAEKAAKDAAALLAASDPATIIQVLHEVSRGEASPVLQKVVGMAGGLISRLISQRAKASPAPTISSAETPSAEVTPQAASAETTSAETASAEGISAEGSTAEGISANRASAAGVTAEGISANRASAEGISANRASAEGISANRASAEGISAEGSTVEGITANRASAEGVTAEGISAEGISAAGVSAAGSSGEPAAPGSTDPAVGPVDGASVAQPVDREH